MGFNLQSLEHAPKKVYFIGGGIGLGFVALKFWRNRASAQDAADTQTPTDATPTTSTPGGLTYVPDNTYGSDASPLISPVIQGSSDSGDSLVGVPQLQQLYTDAVSGVIGNYENLFGPMYSTQQALLLNQSDALASIASAGSSPSNSPQVAVSTQAPVAQPAAVAVAKPTTPAPKKCTTAPYTNLNEANGKCYAVVCSTGSGSRSKGRWHVYTDGSQTKVSDTC